MINFEGMATDNETFDKDLLIMLYIFYILDAKILLVFGKPLYK
jgi:hypothetical protein